MVYFFDFVDFWIIEDVILVIPEANWPVVACIDRALVYDGSYQPVFMLTEYLNLIVEDGVVVLDLLSL